ncbi:hypothetical protein Kpol_1026p10 [Vanderwaltozyma polyspora DSM 70294]|uniref:Protein MTC2 n=1 Tax=Vanderwaltozyma polyspora (strain ATCC 22028 / DSM 70294 / BCRC 21397 / CBS 2163 / NBRC 10782 / NRRL Y-8283 / UCD 57-17) TaxID=436907 RepID=A7TNI0_VANPO|nr:uncharacterized protein Kpol_1026p10 [Vanderwaltozyma polyspora DSM 70294]EDO16163.1 hypothetical protein Kpol_1026p10 [Vanderwaltozyma polyspora DSM 70294]
MNKTDNGKISSATEQELVETVIKVFHKIDKNEINSKELNKLALKLVNTLRFVRSDIAIIDNKNLEILNKIDIFTPLIKSKINLDIICIIFVYCSIINQFNPLIINSINNWSKLLLVDLNIDESFDDKDYSLGFYSVISYVEKIEEINLDSLQFFQLNLTETFIKNWIPSWLNFNNELNVNNFFEVQKDNLSNIILNESILDFYISTLLITKENIQSLFQLSKKNTDLSYFIDKILKRVCLNVSWLPNDIRIMMISAFLKNDINLENSNSDNTGLAFDLQVVMELIDHPEMNYLEESKLLMLLYSSLLNIKKSYCTELHKTLGTIGSTQSLPALINILQFLLSKFVINIGNITELTSSLNIQQINTDPNWFKYKNSKYQLPKWYEINILPPIPPISKSLFVFEQNSQDKFYGNDYIYNTSLILHCLILVISINIELLRQYKLLSIDPLVLNGFEKNLNLKHKLIQQYLELYFIPMMSSLLLSNKLINHPLPLLGEKKSILLSKFLFSSCIKVCEELTKTHGNIVLYHLIKFISKASVDDLIIQNISINLLNHLFFHNQQNSGNSGKNNTIIQLCLENELTTQILHSYINIWNDGTEVYSKFFKDIFSTDQPNVDEKEFTFAELFEFLPGYQEYSKITDHEMTHSTSAATSTANYSEPSPDQSSTNISGVSPSMTSGKFNAYSASSFIPSNKSYGMPNSSEANISTVSNNSYYYNPMTNNNTNNNPVGMYMPKLETSNTPTYSSAQHNNENNISVTSDLQSFNNSQFTGNRMILSGNPGNNITSTPSTPSNPSSSNIFSNTWGTPTNVNTKFQSSMVVNTGKNYILGGHNRIKNNSRAQSIHIDKFENND